MSDKRARSRGTALAALAAAGLFGLSGTAAAATPNAGPALSPDQVRAAVAANDWVECLHGGPTAQDTALANAVNGHLNGKMSGGISAEQASCARAIYTNTIGYGYDAHAAVIEVCAAITEASLLNLTYGDQTSVGLFQMLSDKGTVAQRTDVTFETHWFLNTLNSVHPNRSYENLPVGQVAQDVERSAFPDRYQPNAADAQTIVNALIGQGTSAAYPLFHEVRDGATGNWTGFAALGGFGGAPNFAASKVSTAGFRDGSDQVVAIGQDGNLYHTVRATDGSWQDWHALAGDAGAPQFQASAVAVTAVNNASDPAHDGELHIAAIGNTGLLYYNVRHKDGSWQGWNAMPGKGAPTFQAGSVSMTGVDDGTVQIVASGNDGVLYHNVRAADGSWQGWNALPGNGSAPNFQSRVTAMAAEHDKSVQITAIGNDGLIYHTVRNADGSWQAWHALAGFGGAPNFAASALAMAAIDNPGGAHDGDMQIAAVGTTGNLYHNIRNADGSWQGWNQMAGYGGAAAMSSSAVSMSGIPGTDTVQLIATGDK